MVRGIWRRWCGSIRRHRFQAVRRNRDQRYHFIADVLEQRTLLSTITVTTSLEHQDGEVSLREAIATANGSPGFDSITFSAALSGQTIHLTAGQLTISETVEIDGLGAKNTIVDADANSRVFNVTAGAGDVTFAGLSIMGGKTVADNERGAGIRFLSTGTLKVIDSVISDNTTGGFESFGGGIYTNTGAMVLVGSLISGNTTTGNRCDGAGIFSTNGPVSLTNSTVSGNTTSGYHADGAAIYTVGSAATVTLTNSTVTGNADVGNEEGGSGGIAVVRAPVSIKNSIVTGNFNDDGSERDIWISGYANPATFTASHSIIGVKSNVDGVPLPPAPLGSPDANGNLIGTQANPIDALLGPLADNGGLTMTHLLFAGSPAIDAGDNALALAPNGSPLTTDQRGAGFPRIDHGTVDRGSFEGHFPDYPELLSNATLVVTTADDELEADLSDPDDLSLREAIAIANGTFGPDTITFSAALADVPIDLTLGQLTITDDLTVIGLGSNHTTVDAQNSSRVFDVPQSGVDLALEGVTVTGGKTTGDLEGGGGIRMRWAGTLRIKDSAVSGNTTGGLVSRGGGIFAYGGATVVTNSLISGNTTTGSGGDGAGIFSQNSAVSLTNSTLSGNTTSGYHGDGAAIYTIGGKGSVTLTSSTVAGNSAIGTQDGGSGGIAVVRAAVTLVDSIVSGNFNRDGSERDAWISYYADPLTFTVSHSLVGVKTGNPLAPAPVGSPDANGNLVGTQANPIDALLGPLADNGGLTQTMALLQGSPAIDAGGTTSLVYDQRGAPFARVVAGGLDMGAFENQLVNTTSVTTIPATEGLPIPTDSVLATFISAKASATAADFLVQVGWGTSDVSSVGFVVPNGSFEQPALPAQAFQYNVSLAEQGGTGWTFTGSSGITSHSGLFGMARPPLGQQAGFLQSTLPAGSQGVMSQSLTVSAAQAGITTLSFYTEGRPFYGVNPFQVKLDGTLLKFGGSSTVIPPSGDIFTNFTSNAFDLTAGSHTLTFEADPSTGADLTSFLDAVRFDPFYRVVEDTTYVGPGSAWKVVGNATYGETGIYPVSVTVTEIASSSSTFTTIATSVDVSDAPLTDTTPVTTIGATAGQPILPNTVLASFIDGNPSATVADFVVQIDWGATGISPLILNGDFELPALLPGDYEYDAPLAEQGGSGWLFTGSSGVTGTAGAFTMLNPPVGQQAGILQSSFPVGSQGVMSQTLTVSAAQAGMTTLSFYVEGRITTGANPFQVKLDGVALTFGGSSTVTPTTYDTFSYFTSDTFLLAAGTHTLTFEAEVSSGPNLTSFIDAVRFNPFYQVVQDTSYVGPGSAWQVIGTVTYPAAGSYTVSVTVTDEDDLSNTFTTTNTTIGVDLPPLRQLNRQTGLAGFYYSGIQVAEVLQNGSVLTLIDGAGAQSAGTIANDTDIDAPGFGLTGVFDHDAGMITFSDSSVWIKVRQIAGQWLTPSGFPAGIRQLGTELTVHTSAGAGDTTTGHFVDATHLILNGWANPSGNLTGVLTNNGLSIEWSNGRVWSLIPDFQGDWVNSAGLPTRIEQQGATLLFVNKSGQTSLGKMIDATHVVQGANWGSVVGTIVGKTLQFANGTGWSIPSLTPGYPDLGGLWQTNNGGVDTRALQADLVLTFVNRFGETSAGEFVSPTEVFAIDWNSHGTIVGDTIVWESSVWTQIPYVSGAYINQNNKETGINQLERSLTFTDQFGNVTHGTLVDPTNITETDGSQRTAVIAGNLITWSNGPVWTLLPSLSGNWTVAGPLTPTYVEQAGLSVLFITGSGTALTGNFVSPTAAQVQQTGIPNPPTVNVGIPNDQTLDFPAGVEWTKFPPTLLDDVFADRNFWPFL